MATLGSTSENNESLVVKWLKTNYIFATIVDTTCKTPDIEGQQYGGRKKFCMGNVPNAYNNYNLKNQTNLCDIYQNALSETTKYLAMICFVL